MKNRIHKKQLLLITIINLLFFQVPLMQYISHYFTYLDEILSVACVILILRKIIKRNFDKFSILYVMFLAIYTISALASNYIAGLETNLNIILPAAFLFLRNFIVFLCVYLYKDNLREDLSVIKPVLIMEMGIILIAALCAWPFSLIFNTSLSYDIRFGIKSYQFIFGHPGTFGNLLIVLLLFVTFLVDKKELAVNRKFYIIAIIFLFCTTIRYSFIIAIALYFYYSLFDQLKIKKTTKYVVTAATIIITFLLIAPQLKVYFLSGDTPRAVLYKYSIKTVSDYPYGTGFATYGSYMSSKNYSPLYTKYGMDKMHGLSKEVGWYLYDNFWPMIIAESGIFGFICVLSWFILMLYKYSKSNLGKIVLLYLFCCCFVAQTLVHYSAILLLVIIAISDKNKLKN